MVKTLYKGKWMEMKSRETPTGTWEYAHRPGSREAVLIIATTEKNELILIKNHRYSIDKEVLEFPAGLIDEGENPQLTAVRELLEETGYHGQVTKVFPPAMINSGGSDERIHTIVIKDAVKVADQRLDDSEKIEVLIVPINKVEQKMMELYNSGMEISSRLVTYLA